MLKPEPFRIDRLGWILIATIAVIATVVRVFGIWHEYPFSFYGDEQQLVKQALAYGSGNFNPYQTGMNASKPAFYTYLLFIEYGVYFVVGKLAGWWADASGYVIAFLHRPGPWYVIGRMTTTLFGVATIVLVAVTGEKYFGRRSGLVGAVLMTVAIGHVITCQHVKADNPTAFFSLLAMWFLLAFISNHKSRNLLFAAMAAGFGMATKYYSVFLAPMFVIAIVVVVWQQSTAAPSRFTSILRTLPRFVLLAVAVGMATFFVLTPYTFLDSQGLDFLLGEVSVLGEKAAQITGTGGAEAGVRQDYEIRGHASFSTAVKDFAYSLGKLTGFGLLAGLAGVVGVIYCLLRLNTHRLLLISFPLLFTIVAIVVRPGFAVVRHQTQIYPFLALAAGVVLVALYHWLKSRGGSLHRVAAAGFCLALVPQMLAIVERANVVSRPDPRSAAVIWIDENIKADSHILVGGSVIELVASSETLNAREAEVKALLATGKVPQSVVGRTSGTGQRVEYQKQLAQQQTAFKIDRFEHPWWLRHHDEVGERFFLRETDVFMEPPTRKFGIDTLDQYAERGVEYIVVGDALRDFYRKNADRYPPYDAIYSEIYQLPSVATFAGHESGWGGRTVRVFALQ